MLRHRVVGSCAGERRWFDKLSEGSESDAVPTRVSDTTNGRLSVPFALSLSKGPPSARQTGCDYAPRRRISSSASRMNADWAGLFDLSRSSGLPLSA